MIFNRTWGGSEKGCLLRRLVRGPAGPPEGSRQSQDDGGESGGTVSGASARGEGAARMRLGKKKARRVNERTLAYNQAGSLSGGRGGAGGEGGVSMTATERKQERERERSSIVIKPNPNRSRARRKRRQEAATGGRGPVALHCQAGLATGAFRGAWPEGAAAGGSRSSPDEAYSSQREALRAGHADEGWTWMSRRWRRGRGSPDFPVWAGVERAAGATPIVADMLHHSVSRTVHPM